jgi:nitroreductase
MTTSTTTSAPSLTPDQLLARLRWRYATKRFHPGARIEPARWAALEQALVLSPSSYGLQPWRFLVIEDTALRARLREVSWNQPQIVEADKLVVFAIKKGLSPADVQRYVARVAEVRQVPRESLAGFAKVMTDHVQRPKPFDVDEWAKRQLYLALGTFLTSAALLGVDACPMEGIEPAKYDEILGLPAQGYAAVMVATAGLRAEDDLHAKYPKVRFDAREVVAHV